VRTAAAPHGFGDGVERVDTVAGFDDVVPPALGVVVAGGTREHRDRIRTDVLAVVGMRRISAP
jgi:hypothetical protein